MLDPWDFDSRHPARLRPAEIGTRAFVCSLENGEGEMVTFIGEADYRTDSEGTSITDIRYWPYDKSMADSVDEYVRTVVF